MRVAAGVAAGFRRTSTIWRKSLIATLLATLARTYDREPVE